MKSCLRSFIFLFLMFFAGQAHALTSGTTTVGSIAAGGTSTQTFTGTTGQGVMLYAYSSAFSIYMVIKKPDGSVLNSTYSTRYAGTLPATGTYTVEISATSPTASGSYSLAYVRGSDSVSDGTLTSGQTYAGTLAINGLESFQITGTAGQNILLHSKASSYSTMLTVYRPDGSYFDGSTSERLSATLPVTGTYTVVLSGYYSTDTGSYNLSYVIGGGGVSDGTLQSGQPYNGTIAANGLESYRISGTAGQGILLYGSAAYSTQIYVYAPDGSLWTSGYDRLSGALPVTGTYTVVLFGYYSTDTGPYKLYYQRGADTVSEGTLVSGSARPGNLPVNGIMSYRFTGTSGNSLTVSTTSGYSLTLSVYKPDGSYFTGSIFSGSLSATLPATGEYILAITGYSTTGTGPYTVTVTTPPTTVAASTASKVPVESGAPGVAVPPVVVSCGGGKTIGNPINFDVGFKSQVATDYDGPGLSFTRIYRSDSTWTNNTIGTLWRHNYARTLTVTATTATITDGSGMTSVYTLTGGNWVPNDPSTIAVFKTVGSTYTYTLPDNTVEKYDANKRLTRIEYLGGGALNLAYNGSGQLTTVTNENGRSLTLTYVSGRVNTVVTPDGTFTYGYGANNNLTTVTKPDTKIITYHYENATYVNALTGITDEKSIRYATFGYTAGGKANRSEHAGAVDDYDVVYNASGTSTTTNPLNKNTTYNFTNIQGVRRITQVDGAASANCVASNRYYNYDTLGRLIGKTDWENNETRYQYDTRGNVTQITAGADTPEQQITTITYDPTFNLPDIITEPGKTTDYAYDTFGRTTSVTITDTATSETRITGYTYWPNGTDGSGNVIVGRLKQINGPRTDVTDTTDFAYDANYNLTTITNALGQITQITARDAAGRPTTIRDPNNIDTKLTYDTNGWLKTSTRAFGTALAALTTYDYEFNGLLKKVTLPNGVWVEYTYDNAQRLTGVKDVTNNTITYTLNNAGDITLEEIKDSSAVLKYKHSQVFDELSRIINSVGAGSPAQTAVMTYDKNSNLKTYTDPKANPATSYGYDALQRLVTQTDSLTGVTTLGYNGRDDLTSAKDPRNNTTSFTYNAFGDVKTESSPDRGSTSYVLDKAGNVTQRTDARSVITNYTYDAINRLKTVVYPAQTALNATLTYDIATNCGTAYKGRLCTVTDAGGSYAYQWDVLGRMTQDKATRGATNLTINYTYDLAGNLATVQLPSARTITYTRNTNGRLTGASAPIAGTATTLASSGTYLPFGPMSGLTYGNTRVLTAGFNTDYNPTSRAVASVYSNTYAVDKNSNITQVGTPTYGYDALDRVNAENTPSSTSYTYDLTDNRLTKTQGSTTTTTVPSTSNKISAVGAASYTLNNAGDITLEEIKDSSAVLKYKHSQVFDELSRIINSVGAGSPAQTAVMTYDKNSNLKTYTDPKANPATSYGYDALQRLVTQTDSLTPV